MNLVSQNCEQKCSVRFGIKAERQNKIETGICLDDLFEFEDDNFIPLQTGEKSGQVEKSKKNARQRQNDFKV